MQSTTIAATTTNHCLSEPKISAVEKSLVEKMLTRAKQKVVGSPRGKTIRLLIAW